MLKKLEIHNKKKRLRKKLYLGEFTVYGFQFECKVNSNTEEELDKFLDDVIDLVESRELVVAGVGGGNSDNFDMFVCSSYRYGSVTEEDRNAFTKWLSNHSLVSEMTISELVDVNYGI